MWIVEPCYVGHNTYIFYPLSRIFFFCVSVLYCVMLMSVCTCPDTIVVGPINLDPTWVGNFRDQCEEKTHKGFRYLAGLKKKMLYSMSNFLCEIFIKQSSGPECFVRKGVLTTNLISLSFIGLVRYYPSLCSDNLQGCLSLSN